MFPDYVISHGICVRASVSCCLHFFLLQMRIISYTKSRNETQRKRYERIMEMRSQFVYDLFHETVVFSLARSFLLLSTRMGGNSLRIQFILALYALTHMQLMMDFRAEMGCYSLKALLGDADEFNGLHITTFWHTRLSDDPQSESNSKNSISRQTWNESVVSRSATHEWASRTVSQLMLSIVRHTFYRRRSSSHLRSSLNRRRL